MKKEDRKPIKNREGRAAGLLVLLGGILLIGTGLLLGQYTQVLEKAIRICIECIGIG